jgi:hypothetical protein
MNSNPTKGYEFKVMKLFDFSFKREAVWMVAFSLAPALLGLCILLLVLLLR